MLFREENIDIFKVDNKYTLCHCISSDYSMSAGIAIEFNYRYNLKKVFKDIESKGVKLEVGDTILIGKVFNLITKRYYYQKPLLLSLKKSLYEMRDLCESEGIKFIAMPKIGCGLDRLNWNKVKLIIKEVFEDFDGEILVCIYK